MGPVGNMGGNSEGGYSWCSVSPVGTMLRDGSGRIEREKVCRQPTCFSGRHDLRFSRGYLLYLGAGTQ